MVYVFLANGFEEAEAILPTDILRRGGVEVKTVGVTGKEVTGSHNITVTADIDIADVYLADLGAIVLPGGMPGTINLEKDERLQSIIDFADKNGKFICAICAAPSILGHKGLLCGKNAVCYPGMEDHLKGAVICDEPTVTDGKIITGKGPGAAADFGFAILKTLKGEETALKVYKEMCFK